MSLLFYPAQGDEKPVLDFTDGKGGNVNIRFGDYRLIAINNNTPQILYRNEDSYNGMEAYTRTANFALTGGEVMVEPDSLFVALYPDLSLTPASGDYNITLTPKSMVSTVPFVFTGITGLEYVSNIRIAVTGLSSSIRLSDGKLSEYTAAVAPGFRRTKNSVEGSFRIFGTPQQQTATHSFIIQFFYGAEIITKQYDITQMMRESGKIYIEEEIVFQEIGPGGGGFIPDVGDWQQDNVEIK